MMILCKLSIYYDFSLYSLFLLFKLVSINVFFCSNVLIYCVSYYVLYNRVEFDYCIDLSLVYSESICDCFDWMFFLCYFYFLTNYC